MVGPADAGHLDLVEDVVDAYLALAEKTNDPGVRGEAFNFSPESQVSVIEITKAIQRGMKRNDLEPVILDQVRAEILDQYLDSTKAKQRLGWTARHKLDDGLAQTIVWYRRFLESDNRQPAARV